MKFFRLTWLKRILLFLLLVLLNASSFAFIEQQGDARDQSVIHSPYSLADLSASVQKPQIKYGLYATQVSAVKIFTKIISDDYIPGTSSDPLSADLPTYPDRGPPRLIAIL